VCSGIPAPVIAASHFAESSQPLKILHINTGLDTGGAELMLERLINASIKTAEFVHCVISLTAVGKVGTRLRQIGILVVAREMRSVFSSIWVIWPLFRMIKKMKPDIVQTWMYHADLLGGIAARWAGVDRVIWGIRRTTLLTHDPSTTRGVRGICAWLASRISAVIACAADAARQSYAAIGYPASPMMVIYNGFNGAVPSPTLDQRLAFRSQLGFGDKHIVIASLGRFTPAKHHANFIRAAALVGKRLPHVLFLIVGRGIDTTNASLKCQLDATGFSERFVLLGERSDVLNCYAAMDIFCLHSKTEGFPNVVGEAMAMGLPCVVTDVGDAATLVATTGRVVASSNAIELADALEQIATLSTNVGHAMGLAASCRRALSYSIKHAATEFEARYRNLLPSAAR